MTLRTLELWNLMPFFHSWNRENKTREIPSRQNCKIKYGSTKLCTNKIIYVPPKKQQISSNNVITKKYIIKSKRLKLLYMMFSHKGLPLVHVMLFCTNTVFQSIFHTFNFFDSFAEKTHKVCTNFVQVRCHLFIVCRGWLHG